MCSVWAAWPVLRPPRPGPNIEQPESNVRGMRALVSVSLFFLVITLMRRANESIFVRRFNAELLPSWMSI